MRKRNFLLLIAGIAFHFNAAAQSNVSLKYFGLTMHPFGDQTAYLQPYKLDDNARFVLNFGGFGSYEKYVWEEIISVKAMQGVFTDCSAGLAGITHLGLRVSGEKGRHRLGIGIGPTLFYREDWNRFDGYKDSGFLRRTDHKWLGPIQYKFFWYGLEMEYDYRLGKRTDLSVGFTPGFPFVFTWSVGAKYWINKDFKKTGTLVSPRDRK
jgi:hypothetical protein